MALRARKVSGAFQKRAPGTCIRLITQGFIKSNHLETLFMTFENHTNCIILECSLLSAVVRIMSVLSEKITISETGGWGAADATL